MDEEEIKVIDDEDFQRVRNDLDSQILQDDYYKMLNLNMVSNSMPKLLESSDSELNLQKKQFYYKRLTSEKSHSVENLW